jgi:PBSX family phage terminase large subunit
MGQLMMVGKTLGTLRNNIIVPMQELLGEKQCRFVSSTKRLYLDGRPILCEGANDDGAEAKIRGITLAGAYCDEVSLWPESFWTMLLSRCSEVGAKIFGTTNPDSPYHWLKVHYIDKAHDGQLKNFIDFHFHIDDNDTLPAEYVESIKAEYSGLFYRRFIEGEWVQAEGAIYDMFREEKHVINPEEVSQAFDKVIVAIDYGTANPFVALVLGVKYNEVKKQGEYAVAIEVTVIDEDYYSSAETLRQMTDIEYCEALFDFIEHYSPDYIVIDPSAASFKVECSRNNLNVIDAVNDVLDGIRIVANALTSGALKISPNCPNLICELPNYIWDKKAQMNGIDKPVKVNDHACVTGETLIHTDKGLLPIAELIGTAGLVLTLDENTREIRWSPYRNAALTQKNAHIFEVELEDGSLFRCTPDHEFLTQRGRVKACELKDTDEVEVAPDGISGG